MTARVRHAFRDGNNCYVPALQYASDMVHGQPTQVSLGAPAASDDDIIDSSIDADAVAGVIETQAYTSDSPYGRTLILTPSADPGAAGGVLDVYGFDYLGQPMVERFSGANGATAILYGKKAFYKVTKTVIVTATTNATTYKLGTGLRVGLPYKGDIIWVKENNALVELYKRDVTMYATRSAADVVAGFSTWFRSPCPGYVSSLIGTPNGGGSTNDPVVTVELGGTAIVGLTVTIDTSDTAGLTVTDAPTTVAYNANNRLVKNSLIEVLSGAQTSAKGDTVGIVITPTQFSLPVLTDPQTTTTGDPRGTYESLMTMDGVKEIIVGLVGDNSVNSSNNGGYHGIKHVIA